MNWTDEAIIIYTKKFSENALLVTYFSKEHGLRRSLARYGQSKGQRAIFQVCNHVNIDFTARTNEQLGSIKVEVIRMHSANIAQNSDYLKICNTYNQIIAKCLPEGFAYEHSYIYYLDFLIKLEQQISKEELFAQFALLECQLFSCLGYGYDLSNCAATGNKEDLIYISPRTAKAVSKTAGEPYKEKLLQLPQLFKSRKYTNTYDTNQALKANAYFLQKFIFSEINQELPEIRKNLAL